MCSLDGNVSDSLSLLVLCEGLKEEPSLSPVSNCFKAELMVLGALLQVLDQNLTAELSSYCLA